MNPVEEVALQTQPPLLEDVSIKGALRIPVRDAMDTLEEREIIEADFRWYRWSKFAWPWLVVCLVLCVATFAMTVTQQVPLLLPPSLSRYELLGACIAGSAPDFDGGRWRGGVVVGAGFVFVLV